MHSYGTKTIAISACDNFNMQTINQKSAKKAWAKALQEPAKEFPLTPLSIINGEIPTTLNGTLYRNGPA